MAKQGYLDAYDSGNKEKMLASQEAISKAQVDLNDISKDKSNLERVKKEVEAQPSQGAEGPRLCKRTTAISMHSADSGMIP